MQWTEKEFANIINKGKKAIAGEIVPNLDNPLNEDIFYLENFAYLWSILGAVNLEGMTTETHHKIWRVLKQTNALDAHDKGMLLSFTKTIAEDNQNISQKYWLDLDSYDIRVKFSQEIFWEILKNNEIAITLVRAVSDLGDWGVFPTQLSQCLRKLDFEYEIDKCIG